jgi:hypothetical protein
MITASRIPSRRASSGWVTTRCNHTASPATLLHHLWATLGRVQLLAPLAAGDRRHAGWPAGSETVPALVRPPDYRGRAERLGQPDLPSRSRTVGWCACPAPIVTPRRSEESTAGSPCLRRTCHCRSLFPWRWESRTRAIRGIDPCTSGSMGRPPAPRASSTFPGSRWCWLASWHACRNRSDRRTASRPAQLLPRGPLETYDAETRKAIATVQGMINTELATEVWETALATIWYGGPVWIHGDVAAGNLQADQAAAATARRVINEVLDEHVHAV